MKKRSLFFFSLFYISVFSQDCEINKTTIEKIIKDLEYLSSDRLEGRETGTIGEKLALEYLEKRFSQIDVATKIQKFAFTANVTYKFSSNLNNLHPTKYSNTSQIEEAEIIDVNFGIFAPELNYSDYFDTEQSEKRASKDTKNIDVKNKVVLINTSSPDGIHPHSKYINHHNLKSRAKTAKNKGAAGVIFYTDDKHAEKLSKKFKKIYDTGLPVLFYNGEKEDILNKKISLNVSLKEKQLQGHNLIAEIDNNQTSTIVIGAHYDHIGWGKESSLYVGDPAIHNGADDNASGVAGLLYLAEKYKNSKYKNYNFIFIAFSGEEKGLLGSNAYVKSDLFQNENINYMINMDMIGRLDKEKNIIVLGTGTSPRWNSVLEENRCEETKITKKQSGVGASDHTAFYLKNIPVLNFFTGAHEDYHKPTDDHDKINYKGISVVVSYIEKIINDLDDEKKLAFTKTKNDENRRAPKFSVTLGVIPDYLFDGEGMRIDGIIEGRSADMSGMQNGDIVIQLGDLKITDMNSYMKALSFYNKGDRVKAQVLRANLKKELTVQF
mgnify:CR=1 FL=1